MSDNNVNNYGWNDTVSPESCGYIIPKILDLLRETQSSRVVDIGSGNGSLVNVLHNNNYKAVGVEYDKKGVDISNQAYPHSNFYNFGVQDDPSLLLDTEKLFDVVITTEVIEHLYSPQLLVQYANSILTPEGYLIISTPYHGYLKNLALSVFNKWDKHFTVLWQGGHIKFWSENTLSQLLLENGFKVKSFAGVGRFPYLWKSMILVAQKLK